MSPGAYIFQRPFLRGLFLERLIYGGKIAFQNRLGLHLREICVSKSIGPAYSWKEIYVSNLQKGFTETRLGDVDVTKTQPCKYFVYMDRRNPKLSKPTVKSELRKQQYKTVTLSDCNHLAHVIVLWQIQKFMVLYRYCLVTLYLRAISK